MVLLLLINCLCCFIWCLFWFGFLFCGLVLVSLLVNNYIAGLLYLNSDGVVKALRPWIGLISLIMAFPSHTNLPFKTCTHLCLKSNIIRKYFFQKKGCSYFSIKPYIFTCSLFLGYVKRESRISSCPNIKLTDDPISMESPHMLIALNTLKATCTQLQ